MVRAQKRCGEGERMGRKLRNRRGAPRTRQAPLPLSRLPERVANAEGVSRERAVLRRPDAKPSPASLAARVRRPLPQAGEGKARAQHGFDAAQIDFDPNRETLDDDYEAFRRHKKTLPAAEAKAIEDRFQATFKKQHEDQRRWMNDFFLFWIVCEDNACKRAEACAGDPYDCHQRWWPVVPERHKVHFRAMVAARTEGRSAEEALAHADAEVKRFAEHIAYAEAQQDAQLEALAAAERGEEGKKRAAPRVRML
jgi:hypothetical protein